MPGSNTNKDSNEHFIIQPITTPNKYITSYYDKKEESFLVPIEHKYPHYCFPSVFGIMTNKKFILYIEKPNEENQDEIKDTTKYEIKFDSVTESSAFRSIESLLSKNIKKYVKPSDYFIQIAFSDFYNRDAIISLIDLLLKTIGFRGIQLLPFGFLTAIKLREPTMAIEYSNNKGFVFIDDFTIVESMPIDIYENKEIIKNIKLADNEDIADDFTRLKSIDYNNKYACKRCDTKEETDEKIKKHLENTHKLKEHINEYFILDKEQINQFDHLFEYIFINKLEKVKDKKFRVKLDFSEKREIVKRVKLETDVLIIDESDMCQSALIFKELETSKELWLTDKEWEVGRIRLLKEKVLFYI